jgi:DNA-binding transcriptional MocR family regulator
MNDARRVAGHVPTVAAGRLAVLIQFGDNGPVIRADWRTLAPSLSTALAAGIRDAVLDGQIRSTDRLPAERQLAEQLGVSRGTVVAAFARLRAEGWLSTRRGSGSTVRIPAALRLRYAPLSVDHGGPLLDLRQALPAAPHDAYAAAIRDAAARSPRLLLEDGQPGPGLPELRELIASRFTSQGLPTQPQQILVTAGARAAMTLLAAHFRPRAAIVESPTYYGILAILRQPGRQLTPVTVTQHGWDADQEISALAISTGVTVVANEVMRDLDLRQPPAPVPPIPGAVTVGSMNSL